MTTTAQELISIFDQLPNSEQSEVAKEILRRLPNLDFPPLAEEDLVLNAEALFLSLDQQEAENEQS